MRENHQQDTSTTGVETPTLEPLAPTAAQGGCCGGNATVAPPARQQDLSITGAETPALEPLALAATQGGCCGGSANTAAAPASPEQGDVAECPVMAGTPVNKAQAEAAGLFRDYKGQRYWFCCAGCDPMWDADPDEYAAA